MARPSNPEIRSQLLTACYRLVLACSTLDLSINEMGKAVGSSGRMLVYHFGSKEQLDTLIIELFEHEFRTVFLQVAAKASDQKDILLHFWDYMTTDAERVSLLKLSHEVSRYLAKKPAFHGLVQQERERWIEMLTAAVKDRDAAWVIYYFFQGAIVDLLLTGDPAPGYRAVAQLSQLLMQAERRR